MKQYNRDKYFPQLRAKVINPVGDPHGRTLAAPAHTKANTCTQCKQGGCQSPQQLFPRIKSQSGRKINKMQNKIEISKSAAWYFWIFGVIDPKTI